MDARLRDLERRTAVDPSLRRILLAEYLRVGKIRAREIRIAASLGCQEAIDIVGEQSFTNYPRKVFLARALGAVEELHRMIYVVFELEELPEEVIEALEDCVHIRNAIDGFINDVREIEYPGYKTPLSPEAVLGVSRGSIMTILGRCVISPWNPARLDLEADLRYYLDAHRRLTRCLNFPGKRSEKAQRSTINSLMSLDYPEEEATTIIENAARRRAIQFLLGPLFT
jgi:hypothetical protein